MQENIDAKIKGFQGMSSIIEYQNPEHPDPTKDKVSTLKKQNKLTKTLILLLESINYLSSLHTKFFHELSYDKDTNSLYTSFKSPRTKQHLYLEVPLAHPSLWLKALPHPKQKTKPTLIKHLNIIKKYV